MKTVFLVLLTAGGLTAGPCSSIDVGSSLYGHVSWNGFVPGSPTSSFRQDISNAAADPNSAIWVAKLATTNHGSIYPPNSVYTTDVLFGGSSWEGYPVHYVHGNTQRRVVIRDPTWAKSSSNAGMTAGSPILSASNWITTGANQSYFSAGDVGQYVTVSGAGPGGGALSLVYIVSVTDATHAVLSSAASTSVANATVQVWTLESYPTSSDPGTFPVPNKPRIQNFYGPFSRPWDSVFLDRYLDPHAGGRPSDQHLLVVDVDNCIGYEAYGCFDDLSNVSCASYAAYYLAGGDLQRPYTDSGGPVTGGGSVSGMSMLFGLLRYDEFTSPAGIQHALGITALPGQYTTAFTGPASHAQCCGSWATSNIPFGAKLRLKANFDSSSYPAACAPFFAQMKKYGLIVYDGGATADILAETNYNWSTSCPIDMRTNMLVNPTNFDVVATNGIYCVAGTSGCPNNQPTGALPVISSFTANPQTIAVGQSTMLQWAVSGVADVDGNPIPLRNISYGPNNKLGPGWIDGAAHGESVVMIPRTAGMYVYQLMVQNRFGRTTANVTVTVH